MEDLISVIIPAYNVEQFLDRCMETVVNQTYKNLEIILVDDGSTDLTSDICDSWEKKDNRVRVIHKENGGQSSARNCGLEIAKGQYIGFVDSDDWIEIDMYEHLHNIITAYDVTVAYCDFQRVKKKKKIAGTEEKITIRENEYLERYFYRMDGGKSSYAVWCGLYERDSIQNIKFLEGEITEDVLFTYQVYKNVSRIAFSNQCKYNYFINSVGVTLNQLSKKDFSLIRIWDYIVAQESGTDSYQYAKLNRKRASYTLYVKGLLSGNKDVDKNTIEEWYNEIVENYSDLKNGKFLDWKRKLLLWYIVKIKYRIWRI